MSSSPLSSSTLSSTASSSFRRGLLFGVLAYGLWGIVPLYWQLMITVDPVELIAGTLPRRQRRFVEAWAELHQAELLEDWSRLQSGQPPAKIEPLH